ncbi:hypothetical protein [Arcticibacterium luteifluviistationis]|uniref:HEAT repeat domain-containing protein n=1 Tax=Arcticibacterium luteifluviistationis TaxID=1784714 RepID=A0A2Z4GBW6_9BACT|nr:hypothetical protein [Arcticibacterium luteifluviistationis]AWV98782.1 hypothetical protein DJ013_11595 [Arcticibacterium luteifluviistationis]
MKIAFSPFLKYIFIGVLLSSFLQADPPLKYMKASTINESFVTEGSFQETIKDNITNEPVYIQKSKEGIPLYYRKIIRDDVCFDKECRKLDIIIYWNITGRYLGFELPEGEFLSKLDHEPFVESEYQRLHALLADSSIPLDAVSFEELIEKPSLKHQDLDAVSGATSKSLAEMVVKGAAYTTYKLWNIVNGPTMDFLSKNTENQLTAHLIHLILQSPESFDRVWALHKINSSVPLTPDLENALLEIISSDDFYLSYTAIQAIEAVHLNSFEFQERLFSLYKNANHSIQKELLKTLMEAPVLSPKLVGSSKGLLKQLNGQQLENILALYARHSIYDLETCRAVASILDNENPFISKKAYHFLVRIKSKDEFIQERLKAYKN